MKSCIYEGTVFHRRLQPVEHDFRMRLFMLYLDLAELPELFDRYALWSGRSPALGWYRRSDYMAPAELPLEEVVRDRVQREVGQRPTGRIRMLTHVRTLGYVFNPVTIYYVFDSADERLESVVAEITNTPWKERHSYVIPVGEESSSKAAHRFSKEFHVSPFMPMEQQYVWSVEAPGAALGVHMENHEEGSLVFEAGLSMERRALSGASLNACLLRYPLLTLRVIARIHWEALQLWRKKVPFHSHPSKRLESEVHS